MKTKILMLALLLALLLAVAGAALANSAAERPRQVLSGGASDSAAGDVTLHATLGQPVVGVVSDGNVTLGQGFWHGAPYHFYVPLILKNW
jgi:hypothetical protein